ncbi:hypothetical protein Lalb_Chr05g0218881 [Lupinus albus]|uniref:Uncharacterized protein n=1 Tax=Lupinus albus TaxID=3870 RepID=A0A6A4QGQ5_LUPAL|nr:hypothetical protein Lalb_Chr05g0218881 [Lupinus albus]
MKIPCSLHQSLSYFQFSLFMQEPKNHSNTRKPWYQRAKDMATLWKSMSKSTNIATSNNSSVWKTMPKSPQVPTPSSNKNKLRKSTSLNVANSFTRVCLCAPIYTYNDVFKAEVPPRRSNTYPRSKPSLQATTTHERIHVPSARLSTEGRRVFRGKSLTDDVLMRRFVIEEEAMMQVRRRNQMEVIRSRSMMWRKKLGPSPLSRMVMANDIGQFN